MAELKPCPFCGGEATVIKDGTLTDQSVIYSALCTCCCAQCYWFETKEETIEAWNTRVDRTCDDIGYDSFICSKCGFDCYVNSKQYGLCIPNYCPNCGAKVVE